MAELRERAILAKTGKLEVSDEDIQREYDRVAKNYDRPSERVRAAHILFSPFGKGPRPGPANTPEAEAARKEGEAKAMKRAEELYAKATAPGADFAALAREFSDGPSGPKGGDLGIFSKERMVPEFSEAAFALKPGEVSKPVVTKFAHLIKLEIATARVPCRSRPEDHWDRLYNQRVHKGRRDLKQPRGSYTVDNLMAKTLPPPARPPRQDFQRRNRPWAVLRQALRAREAGGEPRRDAGGEPRRDARREPAANYDARRDHAPAQAGQRATVPMTVGRASSPARRSLALCMPGAAGRRDAGRRPWPSSGPCARAGTVETGTPAGTLQATGQAKPWREANLRAETGGRVQAIEAGGGQAGDVLVRVDGSRQSIAIDAATARVQASRDDLARAERHEARMAALVQTQSVSQAEADNAGHDVARARAGLAAAEADLRSARRAARDAVIRAPIPGVVTHRQVDVGDTLVPGAPLMDVVDLSRVRVRVGLSGRDLGRFDAGAPARLTVDDLGGAALTETRFISRPPRPTRPPGSSTWSRGGHPDQRARAGMVATVQSQPRAWEGARLVLREALTRRGGQLGVLDVRTARFVPVRTGMGRAWSPRRTRRGVVVAVCSTPSRTGWAEIDGQAGGQADGQADGQAGEVPVTTTAGVETAP